jgi:inorganic pyrophosphatase
MISTDFLGKTVLAKIDRPLGSRHPKRNFVYLLNYGFVPGVMSPDGEELDVYIVGVREGCCIAVIQRLDDQDDKLILAPIGKGYTDDQILFSPSFKRDILHLL